MVMVGTGHLGQSFGEVEVHLAGMGHWDGWDTWDECFEDFNARWEVYGASIDHCDTCDLCFERWEVHLTGSGDWDG